MMAGAVFLSSLLMFPGGSLSPSTLPPMLALAGPEDEEPEESADEDADEADEADENEADAGDEDSAPEAATSEPAAASPAAPPPATATDRYNQWQLHIAPGFGYIRGIGNAWTAYGPAARFGAWKLGWRGKFLIGGGPSLVYAYFIDKVADDRINLLTFNGDMIVGGGVAGKFAVYGHLTLGLGVVSASDGATGLKIFAPGGRAAAGVGGHGYIGERFSIGALVDFGYMAGLGVDALLTFGVHFGKNPK